MRAFTQLIFLTCVVHHHEISVEATSEQGGPYGSLDSSKRCERDVKIVSAAWNTSSVLCVWTNMTCLSMKKDTRPRLALSHSCTWSCWLIMTERNSAGLVSLLIQSLCRQPGGFLCPQCCLKESALSSSTSPLSKVIFLTAFYATLYFTPFQREIFF